MLHLNIMHFFRISTIDHMFYLFELGLYPNWLLWLRLDHRVIICWYKKTLAPPLATVVAVGDKLDTAYDETLQYTGYVFASFPMQTLLPETKGSVHVICLLWYQTICFCFYAIFYSGCNHLVFLSNMSC